MSSERRIAGTAILGICLYLSGLLAGVSSSSRVLPLWAVVLFGGGPIVFNLFHKALQRQFSSDLLAGLSILTAIALNEPLAAALVVLMLSGGAVLEQYATQQASSSLHALSQRMPHHAYKKGAQGLEKVPLEEVFPEDVVVVLPQEICPADGVVLEGHGSMDEAYITGEPYQIAKAPGSAVVSGAVNGEVALTIKVLKRPKDSRYAKIAEVMHETAQSRMAMRKLGDRLGAWYTPFAVLVALVAWMLSGDPDRLLAVFVIATPCPLLIAIPVAIIGAVSLAARRGLIVRDPRALELLPTCRTIILDKTGTLTYGRPCLSQVQCLGNRTEDELVALAASLEQYSKHPLGLAIVQAARERSLGLQLVDSVRWQAGLGLTGEISGSSVVITSRSQAQERQAIGAETLPAAPPGLECVVLVDNKVEAIFWFRDEPRQQTGSFVQHLSSRHSFGKVMIVSGDREHEVRYLAERVGIREIHGGKSPEEKIQIVKQETELAPTFFLGDGINDAPAMLAATVGAAFGYQSEITAEAAGVVIMDTSLEKVDELFHISQHLRQVAMQSSVGGMLLSIVGMFFAAFGLLPPVSGALLQELIDILAVLNALRTLRAPRVLVDFT